jgi:Fe-S cluster assembly iron-binding protein IscA
MFELTDSARKELDAFFEGKEKTPIRIYLAPGGCSGPRLALALDNPNGTDTVFEEQGYSFCVNNDLYAAAQGIKIDFTYMGFFVESEIPLGGGGGCAGCAGSCATQ